MNWNPWRYCGVFFANSRCTFLKSYLRKNEGSGIWFWENGKIQYWIITDNEYGVDSFFAPDVFGCSIFGNRIGIAGFGTIVNNCNIVNNMEWGISGFPGFDLIDNEIMNNAKGGVELDGTVPFETPESVISENRIINNTGSGIACSEENSIFNFSSMRSRGCLCLIMKI